jgi:thiosulfate/3-mercaptopyruvate sulfurtransferase
MTMNDIEAPALVETGWLEERLNDPHVKILDASYFVPGGVEPARKQYLESHIPGAIFFDINDVAEPGGPKEHTFPSAEVFARKVAALGLGNDDHVVAYDHLGGTCAAARVWFMFRAFGHTRVSVLNGGRTKWAAEGRAMTQEVPSPRSADFRVRATPRLKSKMEMRSNIDARHFQVLDARGQGRFEGTEPEPRPGLRSGHIPGSLNLPFLQMIDVETKVWRSAEAIAERFAAAGVDLARPLATTCGSGVSACTLALGAHLIGKSDVAIYDGSWIEWGSDAAVPVVTGPATKT